MSGFAHGFSRNGHGPDERRLDHLAIARHLLVEHADYDDALEHGRTDEVALLAIAHALVALGDMIEADAVRMASSRDD